MMKKIRKVLQALFHWSKTHRVLVLSLVTFVFLSAVLTLAWTITDSMSVPPPQKSLVEQNITITQNLPQKPAEGVVNPGNTPEIVAYPATELLNIIKNDTQNMLSSPVINTITGITSVAVYNGAAGNPNTVVDKHYAARYLPTQAEQFTSAYEKNGLNVTVSTAPGKMGNPTGLGGAANPPRSSNSFFGAGIVMFVLLSIALAAFFLVRTGRNAEDLDGEGAAGKQKTKNDDSYSEEDRPNTRFSDVAGCDEAIAEMQEMVMFLKNPERFTRVGAKPPKGALLAGPPGTGKTLLARAVAGEANVPFYAIAGSSFTEKYVGVGPKRVRELFRKARSHPEGAIVFIDEIDAVAGKRDPSGQTGNQEQGNTLNALLNETDGFEKSKVILLAATNRPDMLDEAILRPPRLTKTVHVPIPDRRGRLKILQVHARGKPLSPEIDLDHVAGRTSGMSGAELEEVINEACMQTARDGRDIVTLKDLDHSVETTAMGKARTSAVVTEHDRIVTAWHEAGHTVAAMVLPDANDPVSVSIIPRGPAGGVTWMSENDDIFLRRKQAYARVVVAMGGRAAEELLLDGEFTSGPAGDLQAATETAFNMVTRFGMTDSGLMVRTEGLLSTGAEVTNSTVDQVERILADALETARLLLREHLPLLKHIVEELLVYDTLSITDLQKIREQHRMNPPELPPAPSGVTHKTKESDGNATELSDSIDVRNGKVTRKEHSPNARTKEKVSIWTSLFVRKPHRKRKSTAAW